MNGIFRPLVGIVAICLSIGSIYLASTGSSIWWVFLLASLVVCEFHS